MAAESVLATQITLGLIGSGVLNLLKKSNAVTFVHDNSKVLNHMILLVTSAAGAVGVHTAWNGTEHSLVITGLDVATIFTSLWIWAKQWTIQFLVHRGAFGPVSVNPNAGTATFAGIASAGPGPATQTQTKPMQRRALPSRGLSWGGDRRLLGATLAVWACFLLAVFALVFAGCAARSVTAGQANQTVTMVIADAGTVAIQAEQDYQSGKIPQTSATRTAINDLGAAYNDAKTVYMALLNAEANYTGNQLAQVTACQPASTQGGLVPDPAKCTAATQLATAAKTRVDTAQANLTTSLTALSTKTAAVKAIAPAQ